MITFISFCLLHCLYVLCGVLYLKKNINFQTHHAEKVRVLIFKSLHRLDLIGFSHLIAFSVILHVGI